MPHGGPPAPVGPVGPTVHDEPRWRKGGPALSVDARRGLLAGLAGTAALTLILAWGPTVGAPPLNLPLWDGTFLTLNLGWAIALGYLAHFAIGSGLALLYQRRVRTLWRVEPWLSGAVYGAWVWLALMLVGLPLFDVLDPLVSDGLLTAPGLFALGLGITAPVMLLVAHLVFGGLVGLICGPEQHQPVRRPA